MSSTVINAAGLSKNGKESPESASVTRRTRFLWGAGFVLVGMIFLGVGESVSWCPVGCHE